MSRFRGFYREPSAVFWTFGFPILLSIALAAAFRNRPPEPAYVAVEAGAGAERILGSLAKDHAIRARVLDRAQPHQALRTGKIALVGGPGPPLPYRFDPMRPEARLARALADNALQRVDQLPGATATTDAPLTEPGSRYIDFLVPGLLGMNLMSGGMWGVGY